MESSSAQRHRPITQLLTPSAMGVVLYTFLAVLCIVLNQFSFVEQYLQVPHNFQLTHVLFTGLDDILTRVLGESKTAVFVVAAFWAVIGLGVYFFLLGIVHFISDLSKGYEARGMVWPKGANRNHELAMAIKRLVFQLFAFATLLYVVFQPLAAVINGPVFVDFLGPSLIVIFIGWFIASWLSMHLFVVLLRLMVLKPRLFS